MRNRANRSKAGLVRGAALRAWNAGVDGIYTYNIFYFFRSTHPIWNELGDPTALAGKDKLYVVNSLRTHMIDGFLPRAQKRYRTLPILNQRPHEDPGRRDKKRLADGG